MYTLLTILFVISLLSLLFEKMNKTKRKDVPSNGIATFLRTSFGSFIDEVLGKEDNILVYESPDKIIIRKKHNPESELVLMSERGWGEALMRVVIIRNKNIIYKDSFKSTDSPSVFSEKILSLFV